MYLNIANDTVNITNDTVKKKLYIFLFIPTYSIQEITEPKFINFSSLRKIMKQRWKTSFLMRIIANSRKQVWIEKYFVPKEKQRVEELECFAHS